MDPTTPAPPTRVGGWQGARGAAFAVAVWALVVLARSRAPGAAVEFVDFSVEPWWTPLGFLLPYLLLAVALWTAARTRARATRALAVLGCCAALDLLPLLLRGVDATLSLVVFLYARVFVTCLVVWAWGLARRCGSWWGWGVPAAFVSTLVMVAALVHGSLTPGLSRLPRPGPAFLLLLEVVPASLGILLGVLTDAAQRRTPSR